MLKLDNTLVKWFLIVMVVSFAFILQHASVSASTSSTTGSSLRDWLTSLQSEASSLQVKVNQLEKVIALLTDSNSTISIVQVRAAQLAKIKKSLDMLNLEIQTINQACSTKSGPNCDISLCDSKCLNCTSAGQCMMCSGNWTGPTCSTCKVGWTGPNCSTIDNVGDLATSSILNYTMATRFVQDLILGVKKNDIKLLFRSSRDGFSCVASVLANFQTRVSNKGPTFVIFQATSGAIFGAYTSQSLTTACTQVTDTATFLFSIQSNTGEQRFTKLLPQVTTNSVLPCSNQYLAFGRGYDLFYGCWVGVVVGRTVPNTFPNMGQYYLSGSGVAYSTTGSAFDVTDFEVYSL
ncbi:predicted protein [Naegleria gruberi]|uniref:Predicted protein n=1 Tax=Naegleria gruberi TaxID=5762 RepID=D2VUE9_NAEGR|nr:uncharacterized protein NAEGRDRAFT_72640 [Naegleria gruberi]EFC39433.1 predicted protein [Naegleria gruberi]|eukprot:XP_002672177.1 predicted protein [Naegleria gruberi strain NEG-M]